MEEPLKILDEKSALRIILAINEKDKTITQILEEVEGVGFNTLTRSLEHLKELDLINEKESPYRIREFNLTDRGKKAAEIILELKKLIEEESKE